MRHEPGNMWHYLSHPEHGVMMVYGTFRSNLMLTEGWSTITPDEFAEAIEAERIKRQNDKMN